MLVRLLELNYKDDEDGYTNAHFIKAYKEPDFASFVKMLSVLQDNGEDFQFSVGDEWYTLDTYNFSFPEDDEHIPCINVYVL